MAISTSPLTPGQEDIKDQAISYRRRHGDFPMVICADQIYRTRSNRGFRQRHRIHLGVTRLGRPRHDAKLMATEKQQFMDDQRQRNAI